MGEDSFDFYPPLNLQHLAMVKIATKLVTTQESLKNVGKENEFLDCLHKELKTQFLHVKRCVKGTLKMFLEESSFLSEHCLSLTTYDLDQNLQNYTTAPPLDDKTIKLNLDQIHWTQYGTINLKKTYENLTKNQILNLRERYKLACFLCLMPEVKKLENLLKTKNLPITDERNSQITNIQGTQIDYWIQFCKHKNNPQKLSKIELENFLKTCIYRQFYQPIRFFWPDLSPDLKNKCFKAYLYAQTDLTFETQELTVLILTSLTEDVKKLFLQRGDVILLNLATIYTLNYFEKLLAFLWTKNCINQDITLKLCKKFLDCWCTETFNSTYYKKRRLHPDLNNCQRDDLCFVVMSSFLTHFAKGDEEEEQDVKKALDSKQEKIEKVLEVVGEFFDYAVSRRDYCFGTSELFLRLCASSRVFRELGKNNGFI